MSRANRFTALGAAMAAAVPALSVVPVAGWAQMDEIIVSTRRREESLQDVPIAVTAIGAETIERQNINSVDDFVQLAPSVQFDNPFGPADTRITIRGLSNTRGRSNVAFLIDGIDVTTENLVTAGSGLLANRRLLNDVERIELVKGPQSALYGRAAFAGAISYTTKEPGPEPEGKLGVDFAEDGQRQIDFAYSTPVKGFEDMLAVRVSGVWWDEDGRYENAISGNEVGGSDGFGGALTTVFTPRDSIKIKARVEYTDEDYNPRPVVRIGGGLPEELLANDDGSQDNTWQYTIIPPGAPGNETGTQPIRISQDANNDGLVDVNPGATYTCRDRDNVFALYPKSALDQDLGVGQGFGFTSLGLADFGPGFCLPTSYGDADGRLVTQSADPFTGQDYNGTSQQTFRASIEATFSTDFGTFAYYGGWTDFDASDEYDQDHQAFGRPDSLYAMQQARTETDTDQFSQEVRFTSDFEGPIQATLGLSYWEENRKLLDQNWIIFCAPVAKVGGKYGVPRSGPTEREICDGTNGTVPSAPEYARLLPLSRFSSTTGFDDAYINGTNWEADTESWSAYLSLDWALSDNFKLTFETRYLDETFDLFKPAKSSCTNAFFSPGLNLSQATGEDNLNDANAPFNDVVCESESVLNDNIVNFQSDWKYIQGEESSSFSTPKITLEWTPTDDMLVYFFWAQGQKPGGISQLIAGGFSEEIEAGRFDSEKLEAWEIGTKSSWEFVGFLQANGSFFFQDYTDKQVATQIVTPTGDLAPRILNAGGAEVWGFEADLVWQPSFLEGLTVSGAYTYLDAEYTDFAVESASLQRAAGNGFCDVVSVAGDLTCRYQFSGRKLERTPEHAVVLTGNFTRQFINSDFDWFLDFNASWTDERFQSEDNLVKFDDYWLVDARLGLSGDMWEVIAYVDNVFDDDTVRTGGSGPDFGQQVTETGFTAGFGVSHWFANLPDPRTVGIRATYRFSGE